MTMKCWICGSDADSREHQVKASDLRRFFGKITPDNPVFYHSKSQHNIPIHSAKSNKLKTSKLICQRCNDTNTAKYDEAWDRLYSYISENIALIKKTKRIKLQKVFPGRVRRQSIYFHLYFVKLFGCRITDENMPIDIKEFSESLRLGIPHNNIYITFNIRDIRSRTAMFVGHSEVHAKEYNGKCAVASWYYSLGEIDVQITWFEDKPNRNVPYAWHPQGAGKVIRLRQRWT